MWNSWQVTHIGEILHRTERDGSLFVRQDGLKGQINPRRMMKIPRVIKNKMIILIYITFIPFYKIINYLIPPARGPQNFRFRAKNMKSRHCYQCTSRYKRKPHKYRIKPGSHGAGTRFTRQAQTSLVNTDTPSRAMGDPTACCSARLQSRVTERAEQYRSHGVCIVPSRNVASQL